jgi:acetylornithine deacetylase/succinyl-diaminopimelate desuccinylase-like protein
MDLYQKALDLLTKLIAVPSFSREEDGTASLIQSFFEDQSIAVRRSGNNIVVPNKHFAADKPSVLLNSHHDTVRPNSGYTRDPFKPEIIDGRLFGLGSNDAGGPLVSLIVAFLHFYDRTDLRYNIILAATAEEEISGTGGIERIWESIAPIDFAIVGEPTLCEMATAEKGLMVLDCIARGKPGHAAREEGINAIYAALPDIEWFRTYSFPKRSESLGEMKMTVTIINSGSQHNVVPGECKFTVDVRVTDKYSLEEALEIIKNNVKCDVTPRSLRIRSSGISLDHPLVQSAKKMGLRLYGSPTTSDQALIPSPSVKIGPGDSARSHSADEFIYLHEIEKGIDIYITLLSNVILS